MTRRLLHRVRDAAPVDVHVANDVVAERCRRRELLRSDGVTQGLIILRRPGPPGLDVASVCRFERARPLVPRQGAPLHFSSSASRPVVVRRPVRRSSGSYDGADHFAVGSSQSRRRRRRGNAASLEWLRVACDLSRLGRLPAAPGRPRFVLGGLKAYVGHRTRVRPHDKLGTLVLQSYGRASWRSLQSTHGERLIGLVVSRTGERSDDVLGVGTHI